MLCSHYPRNFDLEAFKLKIADQRAIQTCESTQHQEYPELKQGDASQLTVCLETFKVMCNRSTEGQCMMKYCSEQKFNLTVNLSTRMIWCYECDMDSVAVTTFFSNENDDCNENKEFVAYTEFVNKVILAIRESQGEAQPDGIEHAQEEIESGKMNEEGEPKKEPSLFSDSETKDKDPKHTAKMEEEKTKSDSDVEDDNDDALAAYIPAEDKHKGSSVFGSSNLGNTCFFNSAMQCLNSCRPLVNSYIENMDVFEKNSDYIKSKLVHSPP